MNLFSFKSLTIFTSLFIAACAAYFSIIGIAMLFSGAKVAAMVMASALELGKLVSTSFLFRYWNKTTSLLKIYLTLSVLILMFITSLGIFGYLTSSYQKSSLDSKLMDEKIMIYESQKISATKKIEQSKTRIENITQLRASQEKRLSEAMTNNLIARNPIQLQEMQSQTMELISKSESNIESEDKKIQAALDDVDKINKNITDLKIESHGKSDIITFKFVSDEFNTKIDTAVKWFIILLISVFDPLAICLLLAYNTTLFDGEDLKKKMNR